MILPTGRKKNEYGFTFLELLMTLTILGLLLGLILPSLKGSLAGLELENASSQIALMIRYAQQRAILEKRIYRLNFDLSKGKCWLSAEDSPHPLRILSPKAKIESLETNTGSNFIIFSPYGQFEGATISLVDQEGERAVIRTGGRIGDVKITKD